MDIARRSEEMAAAMRMARLRARVAREFGHAGHRVTISDGGVALCSRCREVWSSARGVERLPLA